MQSNSNGILFLCLICTGPLITGIILGARLTTRHAQRGTWLRTFLPDFLINFVERYKD